MWHITGKVSVIVENCLGFSNVSLFIDLTKTFSDSESVHNIDILDGIEG